jgi:uncharacterized membrane protein YbhN (UPF0104 family)
MLNKEGIVLRALTGMALVSSFIWFYWFQKNTAGYSSESKNGVTHVVASSSPVVVTLSIIGVLLFIFLMTRELHVDAFQASSLPLRFVAFLFDCWFLLLTVVGTSSLLHLLLEAQRGGTFRWRYEQESVAASDGADTVLILANLTLMFMYFVITLARRRQTVGQWLLGWRQ